MSGPQRGLDGRFQKMPAPATGAMPLQMAYVIASDQTKRTVDVSLLGGGKLFSVPVLSLAGVPWIPVVTNATGRPTGADVKAVIGYLAGDYRKPVCLGLIYPSDFTDQGHVHSVTAAPGTTGIPKLT